MTRAHRDLQSFFARVEIRTTKDGMIQIETGVVAFQKPDKAKVEMNKTDKKTLMTRFLLSDGTMLYSGGTLENGWNRETSTPAASGMVRVLERGGVGSGILRLLMAEPKAFAILVPSYVESLSVEPDSVVQGVPCQSVKMTIPASIQGAPGVATFLLGKADSLLRRLTLQYGDEKHREVTEETYTEVQANPSLNASLFVFAPPPGLREIKPVLPVKSLRAPVRTRGR